VADPTFKAAKVRTDEIEDRAEFEDCANIDPYRQCRTAEQQEALTPIYELAGKYACQFVAELHEKDLLRVLLQTWGSFESVGHRFQGDVRAALGAEFARDATGERVVVDGRYVTGGRPAVVKYLSYDHRGPTAMVWHPDVSQYEWVIATELSPEHPNKGGDNGAGKITSWFRSFR
jgi:hypothetical protein